MVSKLRRKWNNLKGEAQGYSGCAHCGDKWNWKKEHTIPYNDRGSGMFPTCDECYQKLSPQERYDYCRSLWRSWGSPTDHVNWNKIKEYVGLKTKPRMCRKCGSSLQLSLIDLKRLPDPVLYCPKCNKDKFPRDGEITLE